jgi:membrane protease YdiL (CAAX protease family)
LSSASDSPGFRLTLSASALWTLALWLTERICFALTAAARPGAVTDIVNMSACVVLATSAIAFAMVRVHAPDESLRSAIGLRSIGPIGLLLSAVAGAGLRPAFSTIDDRIVARFPDDAETAAGVANLLASSSHVALVVGVLVVVPLAQEVFFRGLLLGGVRREVSTSAAVVATSLLFAVSSFDWRTAPTAFALAVALGWLRARTGSVVAPAVGHLAFWAVDGVPILRGADPAADSAFPFRWICASATTALVALLVVTVVPSRESSAR